MSVGKILRAGNCLEWTFPFESPNVSYESPVFYLKNCESIFRFEPAERSYNLLMKIKNGITLPQPQRFSMSYYFLTSFGELLRHQVKGYYIGCSLRNNSYSGISSKIEIESARELTLVFIFHGDVGSTLRLGTEQGASEYPSPSFSIPSLEILSRDFSKLLDGDLYQDLEVTCGDQTFKAHRNVLCSRSEVFLAMLQSDMVEGQTAKVDVKDMDPGICKDLIRYLYTGRLPELTIDIAKGLYEAGDRFRVDGLMTMCADYLSKKLTPDNACEILSMSDAHNDKKLKEHVTDFLLDKKIPLQDEIWQAFSDYKPKLSNEVLIRFYKSQHKQK